MRTIVKEVHYPLFDFQMAIHQEKENNEDIYMINFGSMELSAMREDSFPMSRKGDAKILFFLAEVTIFIMSPIIMMMKMMRGGK